VAKDTFLKNYYSKLNFDHINTLLNICQYCFQRSSLLSLDHELHDRVEEITKSDNQCMR
jgi:hypothetical protein